MNEFDGSELRNYELVHWSTFLLSLSIHRVGMPLRMILPFALSASTLWFIVSRTSQYRF